MVEYKTTVTPRKYVIEFTTDCFSEYRIVEEVCRDIIDRYNIPTSMPVEDSQARYGDD